MDPAPLDLVSLSLAAAWAGIGPALVVSQRGVRPLVRLLRGTTLPGALPSLSVVITARDEEERIEAAVRAVLRQRHPDLECIVVDDRSADRTGAILDRLAADAASPRRLGVVHVAALPGGWLGKCHACRVGAERARGAWLLFMDGDVELLEDDLLARVAAHAEREGLDHVALIPDLRPMSPLQASILSVFSQMYLLAVRAFEMERDRPRGGGGIGAFNLVRRSAYDRIGGHAPLRLDLADDLKLGRLLKESGARQRIYDAHGLVRCPWHAGALGVVRGLEKNLFGGFDFSLTKAAAFTLAALVLSFGPLLLAIAGALGRSSGRWPAFAPLAVQVAALLAATLPRAAALGVPGVVLAALQPLGVLMLLGALWNSALRTLRRGGVIWRRTFYPLAMLKRGLVRPGEGRRFRSDGRPLRAAAPPPPGSPPP